MAQDCLLVKSGSIKITNFSHILAFSFVRRQTQERASGE